MGQPEIGVYHLSLTHEQLYVYYTISMIWTQLVNVSTLMIH